MAETFNLTWRNWIASSDVYAVRIGEYAGIEYLDHWGALRFDGGRISPDGSDIVVVSLGSIPDEPRRPRAEVIERLGRVCNWAGWTLSEQP
jgi:hypothetical protein